MEESPSYSIRTPVFLKHPELQLKKLQRLTVWRITKGERVYSILSSLKVFASIILFVSLCACLPNAGLESTLQSDKKMTNTTNQHKTVQEIEIVLSEAAQAGDRNDWVSANTLLKKGLDVLGSRYVSPGTIDETGMKLVLAGAAEKKGEFQSATIIRRRILLARLSLFREKRLESSN